jgi:hypothetical protein
MSRTGRKVMTVQTTMRVSSKKAAADAESPAQQPPAAPPDILELADVVVLSLLPVWQQEAVIVDRLRVSRLLSNGAGSEAKGNGTAAGAGAAGAAPRVVKFAFASESQSDIQLRADAKALCRGQTAPSRLLEFRVSRTDAKVVKRRFLDLDVS